MSENIPAKKKYDKPTLLRRENLVAVTAVALISGGKIVDNA